MKLGVTEILTMIVGLIFAGLGILILLFGKARYGATTGGTVALMIGLIAIGYALYGMFIEKKA